MKKGNSPDCPFCVNTEQTTLHLFTYPVAISFWSDFIQWYHQIRKKKPVLTKNEIMYGGLQDFTSLLTLNHLIVIGKYFLYKCAFNESRYQFADFIALVREKIDLERYIAVLSNKTESFIKKWSPFIYITTSKRL